MRSYVLALACLALLFSAHGQVYKWTDSSGKTHYGDRPPEDARKQEIAIRVPSYDGPVEVTDWAAVLRRKPPAEKERLASSATITMYATEWCPHCRHARNYFNEKGIHFTEINVETSEAGRKEYKELGGRGVPLILVGNKLMRGFSEQRFEALRK